MWISRLFSKKSYQKIKICYNFLSCYFLRNHVFHRNHHHHHLISTAVIITFCFWCCHVVWLLLVCYYVLCRWFWSWLVCSPNLSHFSDFFLGFVSYILNWFDFFLLIMNFINDNRDVRGYSFVDCLVLVTWLKWLSIADAFIAVRLEDALISSKQKSDEAEELRCKQFCLYVICLFPW